MINFDLYLRDSSIKHKKEVRPKNIFYRLPCPNCNYDGKIYRQIWVRIEKERFSWKCWRCESGGNEVKLLSHLENLSYKDAKSKVGLYSSLISSETTIEDVLKPVEYNIVKEIPKESFILDHIRTIEKDSNAQRYLSKRGFNKTDVDLWKLRFCFDGRLRNRIVIPVRDSSGKYIRAWQGRDITCRDNPPYLATSELEGSNIKDFVLNIHRAKEPVIIVEGYFDLMAVGAKHGVSLIGKGYTSRQIEILKDSNIKKFIVALDGDAQADSSRLVSELNCFSSATSLTLPFGQDPCKLGKKYWADLKLHTIL